MTHNRFEHVVYVLLVGFMAGCGQRSQDLSSPQVASDQQTTTAQEADDASEVLTIGTTAPPLHLANWVKGSQIDKFEKDQIYVIEFWATWCGPCKVSMPHLSELQERFADDVTFIGISDEDEATVAEFLASNHDDSETWDEVVQYTLALEGQETPMTKSYMAAAGQDGIPTAFVVGRSGVIEWIGHPMAMDEPLQSIVDGAWARDVFAASFKAEQDRELAMQRASSKIRQAVKDENWDEALKIAESIREYYDSRTRFALMKANLLMQGGRLQEALELYQEAAQSDWDSAGTLNSIAWTIATEFPEDARDLDWTLKVARRASELTDDENAAILDTVARVFYEKGRLAEAIEWQTKAVAADKSSAELSETLDKYVAEHQQSDPDAAAVLADTDGTDSQTEQKTSKSDDSATDSLR